MCMAWCLLPAMAPGDKFRGLEKTMPQLVSNSQYKVGYHNVLADECIVCAECPWTSLLRGHSFGIFYSQYMDVESDAL